MSVTLTRETEKHVQQWIESGRFPDADTVIQKALEALEAREHAQLLRLRELVLAGHTSRIAGELTEELMDEIEQHSEERFQRGEEPSLHGVQ